MTERRALLLLLVAAAALRLLLMLARGDYIVYDEGYYLLLARSLSDGQGYALNGLPHVALSPLQPVLVALLSAPGLPDLWMSRLLAAFCGALLVIPVGMLAGLVGGPRAAFLAALFTAASPALMSFVPFFPGESWNLYFGTEPLYLLLAFGAVAAASRVEEGRWWWIGTGALAGGAYLARPEGVILGALLFALLAMKLVVRRQGFAEWGRFAASVATAAIVAAPYLVYLSSTLGRWAVSGRVQSAAGQEGMATPSTVQSARAGGGVLTEFVWQGDREGFQGVLYALDASGTQMASQYWGVAREAPGRRMAPSPSAPPRQAGRPDAHARAERLLPGPSGLTIWRLGLTAVVPPLFGGLAVVGLVLLRNKRRALPWLAPLLVAALLPSFLVYVEPRSLLPLAPLAALCAGAGVARIEESLGFSWARRARLIGPGVLAMLLVFPAARDLARAWPNDTALQRVASARRAVGDYVGRRLPEGAVIVSWHPAIALWARREWRVQPYDSFERIVGYARAQGAAGIVFSRFDASPIRNPSRAFTVVLLDSSAEAGGSTIRLDRVEETPLLLVGRIAAQRAP